MRMLRRLCRIELVLIYLVILAGSIVRMTGSGMGCPDWPKCFGYLIPPTERSQLEWKAQHPYEKGQIIIWEESLRVAKEDFISEGSFSEEHWKPYTKHDYALFNPYHTWIEYINRLLGALAGIPMLLLVAFSLPKLRKKPILPLLALLGLFLLGFEAWLGKKVVDGNLIPNSISIHMMGALCIVAVLLLLLSRLRDSHMALPRIKNFRAVLILAILFGLLQILLGTQVREQVDVLDKIGIARSEWVDQLDWQFYVHRTFSLVILLLNGWLWLKGRKLAAYRWHLNGIMLVIVAEILLGIVLTYFSMPKLAQPAHLLLAAVMFGFQIHLSFTIDKKTSEKALT